MAVSIRPKFCYINSKIPLSLSRVRARFVRVRARGLTTTIFINFIISFLAMANKFRRICNCYPEDSRSLSKRIRQMLFQGVPLGENPDVKHDFESSSDQPDNFTVDFDSDIHHDVFDKLEHAQYISSMNAKRSHEFTGTEPTGTEPTGTEPTGTEPTGTEPTGNE